MAAKETEEEERRGEAVTTSKRLSLFFHSSSAITEGIHETAWRPEKKAQLD